MRRFCLNVSLLFGELPLLERFAAARAAGFDAVEMHWHRDVAPGDVRAAIADASLQLALLNFDGGDTAARRPRAGSGPRPLRGVPRQRAGGARARGGGRLHAG